MKITQVMLGKGFGGAERYFVDLTVALARLGHEVQAICHKNFQALDQLASINTLQVDTVAPMGWWDLLAQRQIRNAIARYRPQIVQAHLARGAYMAGKACAALGIPLVVKTHNYVDMKYYRNVDCLVATTADQKKYLLSNGIEEHRISVIPNFSSIDPVKKIVSTNNSKMVIACYGRLVRKKGVDILLRATKALIDSGRPAVLHIGGEGPEHESLINFSRTLGLDQHVRFCGWINDIGAFTRDADVFVLPSLDEPFGIAVLEMMALGKPIIATRTRGPLEILNDETARLVEPGNVQQLEAALRWAADNREERLQKAERALVVFTEKYARDIVVPKLIRLYEGLASAGLE